ncbi:hypothetical protein T439DRAFT_323320 [Meredithblackwellia eburnea MCA 4105]
MSAASMPPPPIPGAPIASTSAAPSAPNPTVGLSAAVAGLQSTGAGAESATKRGQSYRYTTELTQMLTVLGQPKDSPHLEDLAKIIEDLVRAYLIDIMSRIKRRPTTEDVLFLIRNDQPKLERVKRFLGTREDRVRVREAEEGDGFEDLDQPPSYFPSTAQVNPFNAGSANNPLPPPPALATAWDPVSVFDCFVPEEEDSTISAADGESEAEKEVEMDQDEEEGEDHQEGRPQKRVKMAPGVEGEEKEEAKRDREINPANLKRLEDLNDRTKDMTDEEYIQWAEMRVAASFTVRKSKKFREFIQLSLHLDLSPPSEDFVDLFGFLATSLVEDLVKGAGRWRTIYSEPEEEEEEGNEQDEGAENGDAKSSLKGEETEGEPGTDVEVEGEGEGEPKSATSTTSNNSRLSKPKKNSASSSLSVPTSLFSPYVPPAPVPPAKSQPSNGDGTTSGSPSSNPNTVIIRPSDLTSAISAGLIPGLSSWGTLEIIPAAPVTQEYSLEEVPEKMKGWGMRNWRKTMAGTGGGGSSGAVGSGGSVVGVSGVSEGRERRR